MESNNNIVSLVNQAVIALANRHYQDVLKAYVSALESAKQQLERSLTCNWLRVLFKSDAKF